MDEYAKIGHFHEEIGNEIDDNRIKLTKKKWHKLTRPAKNTKKNRAKNYEKEKCSKITLFVDSCLCFE